MSEPHVEILDLGPEELEEAALFCAYDNRGKFYEGVRQKALWARDRYHEGLRTKLLRVDGVKAGFIEYLPGEYAWRPVQAGGYLFIHCIWVRGKYKGHGYGSLLFRECLEDARGTNGVAVVTSKRGWVADKSFFLHHGFEVVDRAPPYFELVVKSFREAPLPRFNEGWQERTAEYGSGITVVWTAQCPYTAVHCQDILEVGQELRIPTDAIRLDCYEEVQAAPSPYGVFNVILDGEFLTHQPCGKKGFARLLDRAGWHSQRA
jgi:ribosomal protein S18 acetylase RimI-like enzyme